MVSQAVQALALSGGEIALLIEYVVERQKPFGLDELDHSIAQQCSRIDHLLARPRGRRRDIAADHGEWLAAGGGGGNLRDGLGGSRHEGWLVQEIGRRVTTNRQLREHHDVRLGRGRLQCKLDDFFCVPLKIPYRGVDLGESDLHFFSLPTYARATGKTVPSAAEQPSSGYSFSARLKPCPSSRNCPLRMFRKPSLGSVRTAAPSPGCPPRNGGS